MLQAAFGDSHPSFMTAEDTNVDPYHVCLQILKIPYDAVVRVELPRDGAVSVRAMFGGNGPGTGWELKGWCITKRSSESLTTSCRTKPVFEIAGLPNATHPAAIKAARSSGRASSHLNVARCNHPSPKPRFAIPIFSSESRYSGLGKLLMATRDLAVRVISCRT